MTVLDLFCHPKDRAGLIVAAALQRSCTAGPLRINPTKPAFGNHVAVFVNPGAEMAAPMREALSSRSKVVAFGEPGEECARLLGLGPVAPVPVQWKQHVACAPAPPNLTEQSNGELRWRPHDLSACLPFISRPLLRYDHTDEWNNLSYGAITADGSPWSLSVSTEASDATEIAIVEAGGASLPFVTLNEGGTYSALWINRPVGLVDSVEWALVEQFISGWRSADLPCVPVVDEIPHGFDAAVTMRLDCDEDIASAADLFALYRAHGRPFSLAVMTGQEERPENIDLLREVVASGGALLSHSATHAPNWGGSAENCRAEAAQSKRWIEEHVPGYCVKFAVSPFHQTPQYVPASLAEIGIDGVVGGSMAGDPDTIMARGGPAPGVSTGAIVHSQQCMLHGQTIALDGDPLAIPKTAFLNAAATGTLFGYLDHPISARYDYEWQSPARQLGMHALLLDFFADYALSHRLLWMSEDEALSWLVAKSKLSIKWNPDRTVFVWSGASALGQRTAVRFNNQRLCLNAFAEQIADGAEKI